MRDPIFEFSHDQLFSTEPIYQISNAMGDFNRLIDSFLDRESILIELGVEGGSNEIGPFAYLRRSWISADSPHKDMGYFNFTYFLIPRFSPERLEEIAKHIRDNWDSVWEPFIRFMDRKVKKYSTMAAFEWLRIYHSKMQQCNSRDIWLERESNSLHYQLLQIFTSVPVDGSIAGTLYKHHKRELLSCKKDNSRIPLGYLVKTDISTNQELPTLMITTIRANEEIEINNNVVQESLWAHSNSDYDVLQSYFSQNLAPWFQNTPDKDNLSFNQNFIWMPVYDGYQQGRPIGCFLGWIFQFLPYQAKIQGNLDRLYAYLCQCKPMTEYLAKDIYLAYGREVLSQEMDPTESSYQFLCNNIYFMEGWSEATTKIPIGESHNGDISSDALTALGYEQSGEPISSAVKKYYYQKIGNNGCLDRIYIDLTPSRFEYFDKDLNRLLNEESKILELTIGSDFEVGENGFPEEHCNRIVNRIKAIHSRLKRTKGIIASAQLDVQKDLAATLSHTYTKVAEAVGFEITMIAPETILGDIRRTVRMEEGDKELRKEILQKVKEIGKRSHARHLENTFNYLSNGIRTYYKAVTMIDRLPHIKPGLTVQNTLKEYITKEFHNSFLPIARCLRSRNVRDTVAKIENGYRGVPVDQWWKQFIHFNGFGEEGLLSPEPEVSDEERRREVIEMITNLRDNAFFELFLNAFSNKALGSPDCDRLFIDIHLSLGTRVHTLTFSNYVYVPQNGMIEDSNISDYTDGWIEQRIERPSRQGGVSGWGMYGVQKTFNILNIGWVSRYVNPNTQTGKIVIEFRPEWIGKRSIHV